MKKGMDGSDILYDLFVRGDPEAEARVDHELKKLRLVAKLRMLREKAGLSHADLARKLGTTPTAIAELEDPDSDAHALEDVQQLVAALGMEFEFKIVKKVTKKRAVRCAVPA